MLMVWCGVDVVWCVGVCGGDGVYTRCPSGQV